MGYIPIGIENAEPIALYYEDHGRGRPVVLIHGYPVSGRSWEKQTQALLSAGYRAITYDRRGFGASSRATSGYDYDTLSRDLHTLMTQLDLRDVALVGHCMGTGEVTRYLATYGSERVSKAALLAPLPPFLLRTPDNPDGVRQDVFDGIMEAMVANRPAYLKVFLDDCFNVDELGDTRVSERDVQHSWTVAVSASAQAATDCLSAWLTDFRQDLTKLGVPILIVQGDQDRMFPLHATGKRLPAFIRQAHLEVIAGGPHALHWTHADEVNRVLLDFLAR